MSFFVREAQLTKEPANCIRVRLNASRIRQRTGQFGHGHIAVLVNQFDQKGAMRIKLTLAARATLRRRRRMPPGPYNDVRPHASIGNKTPGTGAEHR